MADLVFVHLTNPSIYPDDQFSYLESRLLDHVNFDFNCTLPQEASPRIVHLLFAFENDEYVMKLSAHVEYQGADINFATLCRKQCQASHQKIYRFHIYLSYKMINNKR